MRPLSNISQLVERTLDLGLGKRPAFVAADGANLTYEGLFDRVCRFRDALEAHGVGAGDRVLLVMDDGLAFPVCFFGSARLGAIPVPVNPFSRDSEYLHFIRDSGAALIVADGKRAVALQRCLQEASIETQLWVTDGELGLPNVEALLDHAEPNPASPSSRPDAPAFWLYSSGSTGMPKAVVHAHEQLDYTCRSYAAEVLEIGEQDRVFSTSKLFHAYGLGNALSFPCSVGACSVLLSGRPTPDAIEAIGLAHRPTVFFSVPTVYGALLNSGLPIAESIGSARMFISGAEPLPAWTFRRWQETMGLPIVEGLGSTEMLHIYCSNLASDCRAGSSGRPVPGYELRLIEAGETLEGPGVGELCVRGGSCFTEYWGDPERTAESLVGGWFHTRDRYRRDRDGRYWFEGRADHRFKVSGLWVSPATIEGALIAHPQVVDAAVTGAEVDGFVRVKAFVVATAAADPSTLPAELASHCQDRGLHAYELPAAVEVVEELPRTITGKIERARLDGGA